MRAQNKFNKKKNIDDIGYLRLIDFHSFKITVAGLYKNEY